LLDDEDMQARLGAGGVATVRSFWTWTAAYERFMDLVQASLG
jgi:hypothetical protein